MILDRLRSRSNHILGVTNWTVTDKVFIFANVAIQATSVDIEASIVPKIDSTCICCNHQHRKQIRQISSMSHQPFHGRKGTKI